MKITSQACQPLAQTPDQRSFDPRAWLAKPNELAEEFSANCARARQAAITFPANQEDFPDMPASARKEFLNWTRTKMVVPLTMNAGHHMMYDCANRQLRQRWYEAYTAADRPGQNCDNRPVALKLARRFGEWAASHGHEDFYTTLLKDKMIKNPRVIEELLVKLRPIIAARYRKNYEQFAKGACARHKFEKLRPWDFGYAITRASPGVPGGVPGEFEKYFEFGRVKKFLLAYLGEIFDLRFLPQTCTANPEKYWVYDRRAQKYLATVDFTPSPAVKQKLASGLVQIDAPGSGPNTELSQITVSCDFMSSPKAGPTLLSVTDLRVLFHEMGHVIEHVFTAAKCPKTITQKPEADVEEFYSIFVENLIFEPEFLQAMSAHYQTGQKLPRAVAAPRLAREEFFNVLNSARCWEVSMKERATHCWPPNPELIARLGQIEDEIYGPHRFLKPNLLYQTHPGLFFAAPGHGHYLGNGHTYLLGKLLARVVFKKFKDNKSLFRPGVGKGLRDEIYTQRPCRSFFDSYCAYTGENEINLELEEISRLRPREASKRARCAGR